MRYNSLRWGASALALGCAVHAASALAQDGSGGATALDPITVFATLSPTSSFDYPGQVTVVEREDIERKQASDLQDLLSDVPGVFVDGGARRTGQEPSIRGFSKDSILVLLDGARQSFISGHDGRMFIEPDLLKSVEVVKGPTSSLYGSGALGGVIALTTVDASDFLEEGETAGVRVKAGFQSVNDEFLISTTAFSRSLDGRFDVVANVSYRESGDISLGNGFTLPDQNEITSGLLKGTVQLAPGLSFESSWIHQDNDAITPNNPQGVEIGDEVFRTSLSDTVQGTLHYNPADNDWIDGNFQVYWVKNFVEEDDVDGPRVLSREVETLGVKLDNRSRFGIGDWAKVTLTYGGEYYRDTLTGEDSQPLGSTPTAPIVTRPPCIPPAIPAGPFSCLSFPFDPNASGNIPSADADFYGVFTQAEIVMGQPLGAPGELTLLPGVRFDGFSNKFKGEGDDFEDTDEQAVSPKFGVAYKPIPWLLLFGNYGEAFRAPSYNELYALGNHFPVVTDATDPNIPDSCGGASGLCGFNQFIPNFGLKPQDGSTVEVGAGVDFTDVVVSGDKVTLKGSYWMSDVTNLIDLSVVGAFANGPNDNGCYDGNPATPCTSQYVNTAQAELDGVEIALNYDSARWFFGVGYSSIDGKNKETGAYVGILQPDRLVFNAGVKLPEFWTILGSRVTFADEMDKVNSEAAIRDAYTLIDIYASIAPDEAMLKGFRLDLGVDNITDQDYEISAIGAVEPGINFKAAVGYSYKW